MKLNFLFKKLKGFFLNFLIIFIMLFTSNSQIAYSSSMDRNINEIGVVEELRLKVPSKFKDVWLHAEQEVWEPWLSKQNGFLGRQIFWNKEKEEAILLVNWKNKKLWKSISMKEVNKIQNEFEENVKNSLNIEINPFELIYSGELYIQG